MARVAKQTLAISRSRGYLIYFMLGWSINLFRIRGIQLSVHLSFLLLLAYVAQVGYADSGSAGIFWNTALLLACFTCIVLHELGHSFTARHYGIGVRRILLMPIGGMAEFEEIPREPKRELLMTVAGPAVNFVLAALLYPIVRPFLNRTTGNWPLSLSELGCALFWWNIGMGCFNLVPVFPMEGGRILRALLAIKLPYVRATFWAATVGKILAVLGFGIGLYFHQYLLVVLLTFIFFVGEAEYRAVVRREKEDENWRQMTSLYGAFRPAIPPTEEPPLL